MARQSKDEKINHLEKLVTMYQENCERMGKRISELVDAEEGTFMHSPTYLQMKEKISFLENINKLTNKLTFTSGANFYCENRKFKKE